VILATRVTKRERTGPRLSLRRKTVDRLGDNQPKNYYLGCTITFAEQLDVLPAPSSTRKVRV
jgi:hypothetical protein